MTPLFSLVTAILLSQAAHAAYTDLSINGLPSSRDAELSGMAIVDDLLVFLPQKKMEIYWVETEQVIKALEDGKKAISVHTTPIPDSTINPSFRLGSGWEAIASAKWNGQSTLFFVWEDSDDHHAIYGASYERSTQGLTIDKLTHRFPLQKTFTPNYSYESLVWLKGQGLLAIPELSTKNDPRFAQLLHEHDSHPQSIPMETHSYRIADASSSNSEGARFLATSFCHSSEAHQCLTTSSTESRSKLLCVAVSESQISIEKEQALPLSLRDSNTNKDYNPEGLVLFKSGILLINDSIPGHTPSTLRYLFDPNLAAFRRACLGE